MKSVVGKSTSHLWNKFLEDAPFTMFSWKSVPYGISQYFIILQPLAQTTSCNLWMFFCVCYRAWVLTSDTYIYIYFLILSFCPFCSCCDDSFLSDGLLVLIISFRQIKDKLFLKYRTKYIVLANSHVFVAFWTVKTSLQVTWLLLSLAITLSLSGLPSALQLQSVFRDSFG